MACNDTVCGTGGWAGPLPGDPDNSSVLTAQGTAGGVLLTLTLPGTNPHAVSYIRLWRAHSNDIGLAIELPPFSGNSYFDRIPEEEMRQYFYWIKIISINGTEGSLIGPASAIPFSSVEELIAALSARIDESFLAQELRTRIDLLEVLQGNLAQEIIDRVDANDTFASLLAQLEFSTDAVSTAIVNETQARTTADEAVVNTVNAIGSRFNDNTAAIIEEQNVRATDDSVIASSVNAVGVQTSNNTASIVSEQIARSTETSALASATNTLYAEALTNKAAVLSEQLARSSETETLAASTNAIYAETATNRAAILEEATTRSTDTSALASTLNGVAAQTVNTSAALEGEVITRAEQDSANASYITSLVAQAVNTAAAVVAEQQARADATSALASQTTTVQTTLGNDIASVETNMQAVINDVDGIGALYTAKVDVNGLVGGFGVYNDGTTIDAGFDVDYFWVGKGTEAEKPFIVVTTPQVLPSGKTVPAGVYMNKAFITQLDADQIDTRGLSIRDTNGNVILSAGSALRSDLAPQANANLVRGLKAWSLGTLSLVNTSIATDGTYLSIPNGQNFVAALSPYINLQAHGTTFTVSFKAWSSTAGRVLRVDLYPDTLPESSVALTTTATVYTFTWTSAHADMANCILRFFAEAQAGDIGICDIKLEVGSTKSAWVANSLDVANDSITLAANGALSGAGGGQVTIGGLGYTGALDANTTYVDGSGNIQGVSSGAGTTVSNNQIGINASGQLYGVGAGSGTTISNNQITIGSNGQIYGAGGGQVTIGGLGYTGDLNATYGANWNNNLTSIPLDKIMSNDAASTLGFNPSFELWTGALPDNWGAWGATSGISKETSTVRFGSNAARITTAGIDGGFARVVTWANAPMAVGTVVTGTVDMYLVSRTSGLPLVLVRLFNNSACTTYVDTMVKPDATTGSWQRIPFSARVNPGERIYGIQIYVMGCYGGSGSTFNGTVIFDGLTFNFADSSADSKTISTGGNQLSNSLITSDLTGWNNYVHVDKTLDTFAIVAPGSNGAPTPYYAIKFGYSGPLDSNAASSVHTAGLQSIPVVAGQRIEAQAMVEIFLGNARLEINFQDINGNNVGGFNQVTGGVGLVVGDTSWGKTAADFVKLWGFATAPAGAVKCYIEVRTQRTSTAADTHLYVAMPYLGYANTYQIDPTPWHPGSPTSTRTLGYTGTLDANTTSVDGNGAIQGVASGAGTQVDNSRTVIGQNLIPNSDQRTLTTTLGWNPNSTNIDTLKLAYEQFSGSPQYYLKGVTNSVCIHQAGIYGVSSANDTAAACDVYPLGGFDANHSIAVVPGQKYCFSVYMSAHRCYGDIGLQWFDVNNSIISGTELGAQTSVLRNMNTDSFNGFVRLSIMATMPSNAAYACLFIRKNNTIYGNTDSWLWFAGPQFEVVNANASGPSPYTPGPASGAMSSINQITPANASTYIASAAIGSAHIADAAITRAKIGLAAIGSAQIETAAIGSAHIGNLSVTSAHIDNLTVGTNKIADAAVNATTINSWSNSGSYVSSYYSPTSYLTLVAPAIVVITVQFNYRADNSEGAGATYIDIYINGSVVRTRPVFEQLSSTFYGGGASGMIQIDYAVQLSVGTHEIKGRLRGFHIADYGGFLFAQGVMK
jgi:hypothetical protein